MSHHTFYINCHQVSLNWIELKVKNQENAKCRTTPFIWTVIKFDWIEFDKIRWMYTIKSTAVKSLVSSQTGQTDKKFQRVKKDSHKISFCWYIVHCTMDITCIAIGPWYWLPLQIPKSVPSPRKLPKMASPGHNWCWWIIKWRWWWWLHQWWWMR